VKCAGTKVAQTRYTRAGSVSDVDEARAVLERLRRIETLEFRGAPARELLDELRALVREAEAWARTEGDARAAGAVERCRDALASTTMAV
jgi:hypothetical protein